MLDHLTCSRKSLAVKQEDGGQPGGSSLPFGKAGEQALVPPCHQRGNVASGRKSGPSWNAACWRNCLGGGSVGLWPCSGPVVSVVLKNNRPEQSG